MSEALSSFRLRPSIEKTFDGSMMYLSCALCAENQLLKFSFVDHNRERTKGIWSAG